MKIEIKRFLIMAYINTAVILATGWNLLTIEFWVFVLPMSCFVYSIVLPKFLEEMDK